MLALFRSTRLTTAVLFTISLLAALLLLLAPVERTLGSGIKIVYLHVALIWVGMAGLLLAGSLGLGLLLRPTFVWRHWLQNVSRVAFVFFAVGTAVSLIAEIVNWGAIFWHEPRTASVLQVMAAAVIVQVASSWPLGDRVHGLLHAALAGFMLWSTGRAELVLHPDNPIGASSSSGIRLGFYGLFLLLSVAAVWLVLYFSERTLTVRQRAKS